MELARSGVKKKGERLRKDVEATLFSRTVRAACDGCGVWGGKRGGSSWGCLRRVREQLVQRGRQGRAVGAQASEAALPA